MNQFLQALFFFALVSSVGFSETATPYFVRLKKEVLVKSCEGEIRPMELCTNAGQGIPLRLNKGSVFKVIKNIGEGECEIEIKGKVFSISSCSWMDGFADHEVGTYEVFKKHP